MTPKSTEMTRRSFATAAVRIIMNTVRDETPFTSAIAIFFPKYSLVLNEKRRDKPTYELALHLEAILKIRHQSFGAVPETVTRRDKSNLGTNIQGNERLGHTRTLLGSVRVLKNVKSVGPV